MQYVLTLVGVTLQADPSRAQLFHGLASSGNPYAPFLNVLGRYADPYSMYKAAQIMALLFGGPWAPRHPALEEFLKWLIDFIIGVTPPAPHAPSASTLSSASSAAATVASWPAPLRSRELLHALTVLKDVLKNADAQAAFVRLQGLRCLAPHVTAAQGNTQLLYLAIFSVWLLTFNSDAATLDELKRFEVVRRLVDVVRQVVREKVVRIAFSALRNLTAVGDSSFVEQMIGFELDKIISTLSGRKWKDVDLPKDIAALQDVLVRRIEQLSSMEVYLVELLSGNLRWSPVHTEKFWSEHKSKFEDKNYELIRKLAALLDLPMDAEAGLLPDEVKKNEVVVEVACYDLGEFARFHPDGKKIITKINAKDRLMKLMSHSNPKVAKQALVAVQKLLVSNYELLSKMSSK